jgi:two-component system chemotaxis response regulator CheV
MINQKSALAAGASPELELLLFHLGDRQTFGIDVARAREVVRRPVLRQLPEARFGIAGVATLRGGTFAVTDTALAIGKPGLGDSVEGFVIVTTLGQSVHGLLVSAVERIIKVPPSDFQAPPTGITAASYLASVVTVGDIFVEVVDFDRILGETAGHATASRDHTATVVD